MRQGRGLGLFSGTLVGLILVTGLARSASAQADYPFRDTRLTDDQRISDLLGRLTLEEKIQLMSGHPKYPRLGLVFSGMVEGLHGLARAAPRGSEGQAAAAHHPLSGREGPRCNVGSGIAEKYRRAGGLRAPLPLPEPAHRLRRTGGAFAQRRPEPRSALGPHRGIVWRGPVPGWYAHRRLRQRPARPRSQALAGRFADEAFS